MVDKELDLVSVRSSQLCRTAAVLGITRGTPLIGGPIFWEINPLDVFQVERFDIGQYYGLRSSIPRSEPPPTSRYSDVFALRAR
jgi:hypothetical protein